MKTTRAHLFAAAALALLDKALVSAQPAPLDGPAFTGSSNCLANIERDHQRRRRGQWFEPQTMRFFSTRIVSGFLDLPERGATLFITTDKPPHGERLASLRAYIWKSAEMTTLGPFCETPLRVVAPALDELHRMTQGQPAFCLN